jgi:hypothetical protein
MTDSPSHTYRVINQHGSPDTIKATEFDVGVDSALVFYRGEAAVAMYAPGRWASVCLVEPTDASA